MFGRIPPPAPADLAWLVGAGLAGALGWLPGRAGAFDAVTLLAWLALLAPAAGAALGRRGIALFPFGLAVPASWSLVLLGAGVGRLATPLWALCALGGLFALGHALGRLALRRTGREPGEPGAAFGIGGTLLLVGLVATGASVGFGLGAEPGGAPSRWATRALDVSPVALVAECAGLDWAHAQPDVYARAGVEWNPRRPWRGILAGPVVLVVGCALSGLVAAGRRRH